MQWNGPFDGNWAEDFDEGGLSGAFSVPTSSQVRTEWVRSLIESGEYESHEFLNAALDEMLVEKFFTD